MLITAGTSNTPPEYLRPWLVYPSSLTEKLKVHAGDAVLTVLKQAWGRPTWWDKFVLNLEEQPLLHRSILMSAHQVLCWYARTIIPQNVYHSHSLLFDKLKAESLGNLIFNSPQITRIDLVHYPITIRDIEYHWLPKELLTNKVTFWLRRSTFQVAEQQFFYLAEVFLPGLKEFCL